MLSCNLHEGRAVSGSRLQSATTYLWFSFTLVGPNLCDWGQFLLLSGAKARRRSFGCGDVICLQRNSSSDSVLAAGVRGLNFRAQSTARMLTKRGAPQGISRSWPEGSDGSAERIRYFRLVLANETKMAPRHWQGILALRGQLDMVESPRRATFPLAQKIAIK